MRRHFVLGFPRALLSLSQEKSSGVEIEASVKSGRGEEGGKRFQLHLTFAKTKEMLNGCRSKVETLLN